MRLINIDVRALFPPAEFEKLLTSAMTRRSGLSEGVVNAHHYHCALALSTWLVIEDTWQLLVGRGSLLSKFKATIFTRPVVYNQ